MTGKRKPRGSIVMLEMDEELAREFADFLAWMGRDLPAGENVASKARTCRMLLRAGMRAVRSGIGSMSSDPIPPFEPKRSRRAAAAPRSSSSSTAQSQSARAVTK